MAYMSQHFSVILLSFSVNHLIIGSKYYYQYTPHLCYNAIIYMHSIHFRFEFTLAVAQYWFLSHQLVIISALYTTLNHLGSVCDCVCEGKSQQCQGPFLCGLCQQAAVLLGRAVFRSHRTVFLLIINTQMTSNTLKTQKRNIMVYIKVVLF